MDNFPPPIPKKPSHALRNSIFIILGVVLVAGVAFGFYFLKSRYEQRQKIGVEMADLRKQSMARLKQSIDDGSSVENSSEHLAQASKQLGKLAATSSGTEKKYLIASQELLEQLQSPLKAYQAAFEELSKSNVTDPAVFENVEDIEERKLIVKKFAKANDELTAFMNSMGDRFKERLIGLGVSKTSSQTASVEYLRGMKSNIVAAVREDDRQLGVVMLEMLEHLKQRWGTWKINENGEVLFEAEADRAQYNEYVTRIQKIADHQTSMQKKMLLEEERSGK